MRIGRSYKQQGIDGRFDAIVVGSGIGGLASAALLAKHAHKRVLVLERHYTAGGFTHTFERPGYEWDVGVHYIGQTREGSIMRRMFDDISDGSLHWADMGDVYDTFVFGEDVYPLPKGARAYRKFLQDRFPNETRAIDRYLDLVRECAGGSARFFGEKLLPAAVSGAVGDVLREPSMRTGRRTTLSVLRELTDNQRLIAVWTGQWGDHGLPPAQSSFFIHALVASHYFGGGAYPVGGSSSIARAILPVIEAAGGEVITSIGVDEILIEKGRAVGVRLDDGCEHRAPVVISDAGVANTLGRLLPQSTIEQHGFAHALTRVPPSIAHASLYLGFDQTAEQLGIARSNIWVFPDDDHDGSVKRFMADPQAPLPVAYLSFASAKDPDFERRYPGHATAEVVTLAPYEWFSKWEGTRWKKRGEDYEALKAKLSDKMLAALYGQYPQLEAALDHAELSSPLSTSHFAGFRSGEIYGLAHTPERFAQRWLRPRTPIPGLYLAGADICSCGVGGGLMGGVLAAAAVIGAHPLRTLLDRKRARGSFLASSLRAS